MILDFFFSKRGKDWKGGIGNKYHDPCDDWLDLINLKLTSPNYDEDDDDATYDNNEHCNWTIIAPSDHYITLNFERIHVSFQDFL